MSGFLNEQGQGQQKNMFLAILLALGVIMVWQSFMAPPLPPPPGAEGSGEPAPIQVGADDPVAAAPEGSGAPTPAAAVPQAEPLPPMIVRGINHDVAITNVGGRIAEVTIRQPAQYEPRDTIIGVFPAPGEQTLPGAIRIGGLPDLAENTVYALLDAETVQNPDGTYAKVALAWTSPDGSIRVVRTWEADEREFGVAMRVRVENVSGVARAFEGLTASVYGEFSAKGRGMFSQSASVLEGICAGDYGVENRPARKIDEVRQFGAGAETTQFGGVDEQYFMTALVPVGTTTITTCAYAPVDDNHVVTRLGSAGFTVPASGAVDFDFLVFSGPKHDDYFAQFPGQLQRAVDFGMFSFLAHPIRFLLLIFQGWVVNWGIAIILLTIAIKILLFPVTQKGYVSMEKMKRVQPKLAELQKKYEHDRMKLAEEQMKLFKQEGVSPMSGCLPMLAQMPIYFALYRTIWGSAELYNAPFYGWVHDLSQPDPYFVLPILMGGVMVFQQKLMPQAVDNPQMQMVNRIMPFMFTAMMLFLPSGLVLYIFVNMLLSIFQMLYIRKKFRDPSDAPAKA